MMGYKTRSNYALGGGLTQERFDLIFSSVQPEKQEMANRCRFYPKICNRQVGHSHKDCGMDKSVPCEYRSKKLYPV